MIVFTEQQGSEAWLRLRLGKVTSTRIKRIMTTTWKEVIDEIIAEQEYPELPYDDYISDDMQRGLDMEPLAITHYERTMGVTVDRSAGFIVCEKFPILGYSPDGLIGSNGGVEVKCPTTKVHVKRLRENKLPNDYKYQIFTAFLVNENLEYMDFVSFDPRLERRPIFVHRTYRMEVADQLLEIETQLNKFNTELEKVKSEIFF